MTVAASPPGSGRHCDSAAMVRRDSLSGELPILVGGRRGAGRRPHLALAAIVTRDLVRTASFLEPCAGVACCHARAADEAAGRPVSIDRAARGGAPGHVRRGRGEPRGRDRALHSAATVPQIRRARAGRRSRCAATPRRRRTETPRSTASSSARSASIAVAPAAADTTECDSLSGRGHRKPVLRWIRARPCGARIRGPASSEAEATNLRVASRGDRGNAVGAHRVLRKTLDRGQANREPRMALRPAQVSCVPWIRLTEAVVGARAKTG